MGQATAVATFACGCFWSKEYFFSKVPGVVATRAGYTGGHRSSPTYQEVCTKTTGHAEAVEVHFDTSKIRYEDLVRFFFEMHDPTIDRRDRGGQYRSAIFGHTPVQLTVARSMKAELEAKGYNVTTEIEPAKQFWQAEDRHQQYCRTRGFTPKSYHKDRWGHNV